MKYLTNFRINLFSDLINIRSCFCFMCVYLCRFISGVKSILKLYLSKSFVTDGRVGEKGQGSTKYQGPITGFEGSRSYKTFFFRAKHTRNVGVITSSL